jgi:hypothetical protein
MEAYVVLDGWATDNGPQKVDRSWCDLSSLCETGISAAELASWLVKVSPNVTLPIPVDSQNGQLESGYNVCRHSERTCGNGCSGAVKWERSLANSFFSIQIFKCLFLRHWNDPKAEATS